ncbi:Peptidase T [Spironucleus salmonicida]|uniref:Peptidase T n=1 Tax=Spironucleus salmonicida TaxID=348837 RepID=V6LUP9_9EUKA|nr:Peptidase T [Spironucleus salmonicida]|eukprot:EST44534.1 Peptidase T [Spironucleus salmonicida]
MDFKASFIEKFMRYAQIASGSSSTTGNHPSTQCQFDVAKILKKELEDLGFEAILSEFCYVYCTINKGKKDRVCLVCHMDTNEDAPNSNVHPQIHEYKGGNIILNNDVVLTQDDLFNHNCKIGDTLITSDGTTLIGGDDKAGIAIVMTLIQYLQENQHLYENLPEIVICFTPDEEIGEGVNNIDFKYLKKDDNTVALTVDGSVFQELNISTFSARGFEIKIEGYNIHPGYAYKKMVNSIIIGAKLTELITQTFKSAEQTKDEEGYINIMHTTGEISNTKISGIIRSFQNDELMRFDKDLIDLVNNFAKQHESAKISITTTKQYMNMRTYLPQSLIDKLFKLGEKYESKISQIRGGTDGSRLSEMGLPTPNIWDGAFNYHSVKEVVNVRESVSAISYLLDFLSEK